MGNRGIVEEELKGEECGREGECSQLKGSKEEEEREREKVGELGYMYMYVPNLFLLPPLPPPPPPTSLKWSKAMRCFSSTNSSFSSGWLPR